MDTLLILLSLVWIAGWIWTIVSAFKTGGTLWGILNIIPVQPLIGVITYLIGKVDRRPVGLTAIAFSLTMLIRTLNK